jgi:hypothetical protein
MTMTKQDLIRSLEGKYFKNANGQELHIVMGGYNTPSGYVRLSRLDVSQLRQIAKVSYRKEQ